METTTEQPGTAAAATEEVVVEVHKLNKSFGRNRVLQDFDMDLRRGENVVVLGKSGSGKSVLIKCMVGLIQPDSGTVRMLGKDVTSLTHDELDKLRVKIGFLFQSDALYDSMTVRENLEFPLRHHRKDKSPEDIEKTIMETLKSVGLEKTADMLPSELSGGMKKRIALARTLILRPDIILYDEPTSGLDSVTSLEISKLILEIQKKYNTSSIIISHDIRCAEIIADRVAVLVDGQCKATGTFEELEHSEDPDVRQFFQ